jgi:hypothetical protein
VNVKDRYRAVMAAIMVVLGLIVLVRTVTDVHTLPFALLGLVLMGLGLYRLNQVRAYMNSVRR